MRVSGDTNLLKPNGQSANLNIYGFDTWFLRVRYGVKRTQSSRLLDAAEFSDTHIAHLLKLQDIQDSSQAIRLIDQFC